MGTSMDIGQGLDHAWGNNDYFQNIIQEPLSPHTPVLCKEGSGPIAYANTICELQKPTEVVYVLTEVPTGVLPDPNQNNGLDEPSEQQQNHHSKHRKHRHGDHAAHSSETLARPQLGRSRSFSSGSDNSSSASKSISSHSSQLLCSTRIKSFTTAQTHAHAHRHRLSACSAASSSSSICVSCGHSTNTGRHPVHHQHSNSAGLPGLTGARGCSRAAARQHPHACVAPVLHQISNSTGAPLQYRPLLTAQPSADRLPFSSSVGLLPQRGLLLAESVSVQDIGKGFQSHWYLSNRTLQVFDGVKPADFSRLLRRVPQQPGLLLWLVKPPCSRHWVPVRVAAAEDLQQQLASCLHADGSCGPQGSKQRVLLDLQCRGFAVQVRFRLMKPSCSSVQQDLLSKLRQFDFALNDTDNNGCRPLELPDGRPAQSYPCVVGQMMALYQRLFGQQKLS